MPCYLGIDLGGTNIAVGLVDERCRILAADSVKTRAPRPAAEIAADMAQLCRRLCDTAGIALPDVGWAGFGSPGMVCDGVVDHATNLDLYDAPIGPLLREALGLAVYGRNDADCAAYGEYLAGVGAGCHSLVAMTIGTGVGSGVVLNGRIYDGFNGVAGELGHIIVSPGGRRCTCGKRGCFETYCSATGLIRSTREAMERSPGGLMDEMVAESGKVSGRTAFAAMRRGDSVAREVVEDYLEVLSVGVSNIINLFQPEVFCIGGGVSKEGDPLIVPLREKVRDLTFAGRGGLRTRIVQAKLGNDAGIIGAAMLGKLV